MSLIIYMEIVFVEMWVNIEFGEMKLVYDEFEFLVEFMLDFEFFMLEILLIVVEDEVIYEFFLWFYF